MPYQGVTTLLFFSENKVGKATFLKYLYHYATFITGGKHGTVYRVLNAMVKDCDIPNE